jgi:8-oxo-dGTP pyrophosphatase MutT (NUDIX family)
MTRAVALIVQDGLVALIERRWEGEAPYYLFPGGKGETGETAEMTVVREVKEELGLDVSVGPLAAEVSYEGHLQYFYRASILGGVFGSGEGPENAEPSFRPVWQPIARLTSLPVRPLDVARIVEQSAGGWPRSVLRLSDPGVPQA